MQRAKPGPHTAIPEAWYCVGLSRDLKPGQIESLHYFGRDLVLYRTELGRVRLVDAHCPHLGAHLGGGKVTGEKLRCGFHGFCFDDAGHCVEIPTGGKPPPKARVRHYEVREKHGFILAYYHPADEAPTWEVGDRDTEGWSNYVSRTLEFRGHPQETSENSVDFLHFTIVHDFDAAEELVPLKIQEQLLTVSYAIDVSLRRFGIPKVALPAKFDIYVHGLGYSLVDGRIPVVGFEWQNYVLATPIDETHVSLRLATRARLPVKAPRLAKGVAAYVFNTLVHEVSQDKVIWERKKFLDRPALAGVEGNIAKYRKWCRQFYREPDPVEQGDDRGSVRRLKIAD